MTELSCSLAPTLRLPRRMPSAARAVLRMLASLRHGHLLVRLPDGEEMRFGVPDGAAAVFNVHDLALFDTVLARGDVGFGEAYIDGQWDSPDLAALLGLLVANREVIAAALYGNWMALVGARLRHRFNANTRQGSRRNIMAHYDLGNDFYARWLDPTMSYSAALFTGEDGAGDVGAPAAAQRAEDGPLAGQHGDAQLADAQLAKYRRILRRLDVQPGQHILEVGCGWGGFAEVAAGEFGARVTGITLSPAQLAFARERIERAGLAERVELRLQDYRDLEGRFDHIVSIEMFEAVGEAYWATYFAKLAALLPPGGRAIVQTITMHESLYANYRSGTDFIQQHVFPGGMLPSKSLFIRGAWAGGLMVREAFAFGRDYARTLAHWLQRFDPAWPQLAGQGLDERFRRLWRFYLAYCEAGFAAGSTDVVQFELEKA